jgi:glutathione S-transferase
VDNLGATLSRNDYLLGEFCVADAYLYAVLTWLPHFSIDIKRWPALARFMDRISARATVKAALAAEQATPAV